ncbi:MAG: hypothetical protein J6Y85_00290 [Alphaproteobacteria bacterium]|nr:hypothetical protein [Alphaproteobacteria bacterium]
MKHFKPDDLWYGKVFFYLFSISWLVICLYGFISFGWLKQVSDMTPIEFVIQFCSILFPVFVLFLLGAHWDKSRKLAVESQTIRHYLEELIYPTDKGKQYINELTTDLKEQISLFRKVFSSMSEQTESLRNDLCQWIGDLNTIIEHVDGETLQSIQKISQNMQTLADTTATANAHVVDSVQALATSADILNQVTHETVESIQKTSEVLQIDTEEIQQTAHAVVHAQTQIESALDKSGKLVSVLTDNTKKIEQVVYEANQFKDFLQTTDALSLRLKEMSTTLDMRLHNIHSKIDGQSEQRAAPQDKKELTSDMMKQIHFIIDQLYSASIEVSQVLKLKDENALWDKYYAGDKAVFVRTLGAQLSAQKRKKVIELYQNNKNFKQAVHNYKDAFEHLSLKIKDSKEDSIWLGILVGSDIGRLYMVISDILKGQIK